MNKQLEKTTKLSVHYVYCEIFVHTLEIEEVQNLTPLHYINQSPESVAYID